MTSTSTDRRQGVNSSKAIKVPCKAATTANITLSGEQTINGISCVDGDRVLVKDQTTASENGIYVVDTSTWSRDLDWDGTFDVGRGTFVYVTQGTNAGFWIVTTADPIVIGTTSVTITQASSTLAVVSAFMQTLLDDTSAAAARSTLGLVIGTDIPSLSEAILDAIIDAKGDLIAGSAADTPTRLAVGSNGLFLETASGETTGLRWGNPSKVFEGRLTLTSGTAVTTSDVTAATTVYLTPFHGDKIALYDGTNWRVYTFTELSVAVPATTNQMYDIFVYDNAGTLTLDATAWTNDTTRATALVLQNGVYVKTGATSRRYVGSFRTTGVSGQTEDSEAKRYVWNYYNRVMRTMKALEATNSWTYSTATWRQANAAAANQLDMVIGVSEDAVQAKVYANVVNSTGGPMNVAVGVGVNVTNANSAQTFGALLSAGHQNPIVALYAGYPSAGRVFLAWLEISDAVATTTWYGDNGSSLLQSGIVGQLLG